MIGQLKVKNYRSLADVTVSFDVLTVLVGLNGSGKSNLVDVLRFVSEALTHGLDSAVIKRHGMSACVVGRAKAGLTMWRSGFW